MFSCLWFIFPCTKKLLVSAVYCKNGMLDMSLWPCQQHAHFYRSFNKSDLALCLPITCNILWFTNRLSWASRDASFVVSAAFLSDDECKWSCISICTILVRMLSSLIENSAFIQNKSDLADLKKKYMENVDNQNNSIVVFRITHNV